MIPALISPQMTELQNQDARLVMSDKALKREIEELNARGSQPNADDNESQIALVLADPDNIITASDNNTKIKTAWQKRAAIDTARQSLKPRFAKARYDAGTAILKSPEVQKQHGEIMKRLVSGLVDASKAWVELHGMSLEIREKDMGFRCGICEVLPSDLFGAPNQYSPLANFLNAAMKAGFLKAQDLPKEFRA
jgi:hypothetical protein